MTEAKARRVILGCLVVTGALTLTNRLARDQVPPLGIVLGTAGAAIFLAMLSELAPQLAAMFAVLIMAGSWSLSGPPVFRSIARLVTGGD
jgi:hypothetical protein